VNGWETVRGNERSITNNLVNVYEH
jgi:hypothetical protein